MRGAVTPDRGVPATHPGHLTRSLRISGLAYLSALRSPVVWEGFIGGSMIVVGSLTSAYLPANSPWWSRLGTLGLDGPAWRVVGTILVLAGVVLLIDSWLRLRPGRQWERPRGIRAGMHPWAVLGVWGLPFLLAPPIFSHDAYSYAAQGWLVVNDISPYDGYPGLLPGAFADQVSQEWRYTKTPYGPLAIQIQHLMVNLVGQNPYWSAVAMRIPAVLGVILIGVLLSRIARRTGHDPYFAAWFGTLNPILLIDYVGGAHNDSLMMGLMVLGLLVATLAAPSWIPAALIVGVAASIKQPAFMAALALPFLRHPMTSWRWAQLRPALGRMIASLALSVGSFSLVSWLTGLGFGWYHAVDVPGMVITVSPSTLIGLGARQILNLFGATGAAVGAIKVSQTIGLLCGLVVVAVIAVKELPRRPLTFLAWGYLIVTLAAPALHSWYVMWGALLLPMVDDAVRYVRSATWATVALLAYAAVNLSWRNGAVAIGVAAVVVLAVHNLWHERSTGEGRWGLGALRAAGERHRVRNRRRRNQ
ncbi:Alpha-(1-_6)-mannopyranosyltransferase A [Acidipropionibacterium virtanenii]|uniref:Alpha-(1->6)-mannopyranosyltransferase A n=2 Tax=Acidipropionibacterium virtanenii TaxID=2057246 RepID=A0A344US46_9ACTN|nr:Alpha-(1->6)-mannopyranosyltransferase A [Acidipropionibacterium virtanenii]